MDATRTYSAADGLLVDIWRRYARGDVADARSRLMQTWASSIDAAWIIGQPPFFMRIRAREPVPVVLARGSQI
jgi:hypothetical protein